MSSVSDRFTTKGALLVPATELNAVGSRSHSVQFYEDDAFLVDSLSRWFDEGLTSDGACIFIGTDEHRFSLEERLGRSGVDFQCLRQQGRYSCPAADGTL